MNDNKQISELLDKYSETEEIDLSSLLNDNTVSKFCNKNELDQNYVKDNALIFSQFVENRKLCENCNGLAFCKQKREGERFVLSYQKPLTVIELAYCEYKDQSLKKEKEKKTLLYSDIPQSLKDLGLRDLDIDDSNRKLIYYYLKILDGSYRKGLYLYGPFGTGKTYSVIALCNELSIAGKTCAFVKLNDFISTARKLAVEDPGRLQDLIDLFKRVEFLFIDDIGSENVSAFSRDDVLFTILDKRMESKKTTFFTSNQDLKSLEQHYSYDRNLKQEQLKAQRLMERIRILAEPVCLNGKNRRG